MSVLVWWRMTAGSTSTTSLLNCPAHTCWSSQRQKTCSFLWGKDFWCPSKTVSAASTGNRDASSFFRCILPSLYDELMQWCYFVHVSVSCFTLSSNILSFIGSKAGNQHRQPQRLRSMLIKSCGTWHICHGYSPDLIQWPWPLWCHKCCSHYSENTSWRL